MKIVNFLISSYILGTTDFLKAHFLVHKSLEDITKKQREPNIKRQRDEIEKGKRKRGLEKVMSGYFIAEKIKICRKQQGKRQYISIYGFVCLWFHLHPAFLPTTAFRDYSL